MALQVYLEQVRLVQQVQQIKLDLTMQTQVLYQRLQIMKECLLMMLMVMFLMLQTQVVG